MRDALLLAMGLAGVTAEFVWPWTIAPGVAGGVLAAIALARILPVHARVAAGVAAPFAVLWAVLIGIAWRARRAKLQ